MADIMCSRCISHAAAYRKLTWSCRYLILAVYNSCGLEKAISAKFDAAKNSAAYFFFSTAETLQKLLLNKVRLGLGFTNLEGLTWIRDSIFAN